MIVVPNIRLAEIDDSSSIAEMSRRHVEMSLGWSWTDIRVLAAIRNEATNVVVVREHDRLTAFAIMQYGDSSAHLTLLAVSPARRRCGVGHHLVAWLEKSADTAGIGQITLEARADNPGALDFYAAQGYTESARIAGYYRGRLDAVRMHKCLWSKNAPDSG